MTARILAVAELDHAGLVEGHAGQLLTGAMQVDPYAVIRIGRLATDLANPIGLDFGVGNPGTVSAELEAG